MYSLYSAVQYVETAGWGYRFLRWAGGGVLTRFLLGFFSKTIQLKGFAFVPARNRLDRMRSIEDQLRKADEVDAAWMSGVEAAKKGREIRRVKRLVLPNPESASFKWLVSNLPSGAQIKKDVLETTRLVQDNYKTKIKWSRQFIGASFMLGDPTRDSGWVQFEVVLPFSRSEQRPSFSFHRSKDEEAFSVFIGVFNDLWCDSLPPDDNVMRKYRESLDS